MLCLRQLGRGVWALRPVVSLRRLTLPAQRGAVARQITAEEAPAVLQDVVRHLTHTRPPYDIRFLWQAFQSSGQSGTVEIYDAFMKAFERFGFPDRVHEV